MGEVITDPEKIRLLRKTPWVEVKVYSSPFALPADAQAVSDLRGMVQAGPASTEGYVVANGSQWTPRELYILRLDGDIDAFLGQPAEGRSIVKIGLAASPDMRRQSFQKAMPRGAFRWIIDRTTSSCGMAHYASHSVAVKGENAMKCHLAEHAEWLGGEFYLATDDHIETAWQLGCQAAASESE